MLEDLREMIKKFQRHRSLNNKVQYEEKKSKVEDYMERVKEVYKIDQCKMISEAKSEKEKWKIVNRLTNSDTRMTVQPIRKKTNGKEEYVFDDEGIIKEMEDYHICKDGAHRQEELDKWIEEQKMKVDSSEENDIMNLDIQGQEVDKTFGTCLGSPGPDGFRGSMIDKAERKAMRECLIYLYNSCWNKGLFSAS